MKSPISQMKLVSWCPLAAMVAGFAAVSAAAAENVLDEYVAKDDGALAVKLHDETNLLGVRALTYRLTSQEWRGRKWQHWLSVLIPKEVDPHRKGVLVINGGSSDSRPPGTRSREAVMFANSANQLRAPIALLSQVPNQPLFGKLYEDDLIAHTFQQFLDGGGDDWPLLLPMTKSAVRAMDALSKLASDGKLDTPSGSGVRWDEFIVAGASKRGWTTWLTAAVDARVCAIAPMVIDVLDMPRQMERQQRTYGGFSDMIRPYTERGIQQRMDSDEGRQLNALVDPIAYVERFKVPKLVMLGTNDPYWTADAAGLYFDRLPDRKWLYYLPNAGHGLGFEAVGISNAFFAAQLDGEAFPQLESARHGDELTVEWSGGELRAVEHWSATSADRDFRRREWSARRLEPVAAPGGGKRVVVRLEEPADGWSAHFVRVTFAATRAGMPDMKLATPIVVLPENFPFEAAPAKP